jgi:hypothetical protein
MSHVVVMLLTRNILASNLDPENTYPDWEFCVFYEIELHNAGIVGLFREEIRSLFKLFYAVKLKKNYFVNRETNMKSSPCLIIYCTPSKCIFLVGTLFHPQI